MTLFRMTIGKAKEAMSNCVMLHDTMSNGIMPNSIMSKDPFNLLI